MMLMKNILPNFRGTYDDLALSGSVYGVLVNDLALLMRIGDDIHSAPYKAPPRAPVIYVKPRNTLVASGATVTVDRDVPGFEVAASIGLVIRCTCSHVSVDRALEYVAGYLLVIDLTVPHLSYYRPSVRYKARDLSCLLGTHLAPVGALDPDRLTLEVAIDGRSVQRVSTAGRLRTAATLLADVTEFMTLRRGDVLLTGLSADAPVAKAGQRIRVSAPGLGEVHATLVAEPDPDSAGASTQRGNDSNDRDVMGRGTEGDQ